VQIRNINKLSKLNELKKSIFADGVIDEAEVKQLREVLYADSKIEKALFANLKTKNFSAILNL
jgi:hypothetical protein